MACSTPHVIRQGDNLYHLAKAYRTTVPAILAQNPNLDPYNLKIGSTILICPGEGGAGAVLPNPDKQIKLIDEMRLLWSQHVYWTRMALISIAERLADQSDTVARLMHNPQDFALLFGNYYNAHTAQAIRRLLTEHLQIGAALITALRDGNKAEADRLNGLWYKNADQMAEAFSGVNPYYDKDVLRQMFYQHLQLTTEEVAARLSKNYPSDIEAFEKVEKESLEMADYFSKGLMRQFPQYFD